MLITNDPWLSAGHFFDITVFTPVFHQGRIIAYFGSTIHHTDIGGYGVGAGARDVHEEGLWIPISKLYERGRKNALLHDIIRHNVRTPDHVFGDLAAQVSSGRVGVERLTALCERHGLADIDDAERGDHPPLRGRDARTRSARCKAGTTHGESSFDVPGGDTITLKAAVTIDTDKGEILIDFAGSSGPSPYGINVVMNYTHAYSTFAIRSCLNPDLPNNYGSLAPIKVTAPEGCIVNCKYPAPVNARHVVGMYVPMPILKALYPIMPERVLAEGAGAVWTIQIHGYRPRRAALHQLDVQLFGRHGRAADQGRPRRDLLSDRRRRRAGRGAGGVDADPVHPEGAAHRLGRRGQIARRRRPDDRLPHAHRPAPGCSTPSPRAPSWHPRAWAAAATARPAGSSSTASRCGRRAS